MASEPRVGSPEYYEAAGTRTAHKGAIDEAYRKAALLEEEVHRSRVAGGTCDRPGLILGDGGWRRFRGRWKLRADGGLRVRVSSTRSCGCHWRATFARDVRAVAQLRAV